MAKGDKHRGGDDNAPETPKVEKWEVAVSFFDKDKKRVAEVGEEIAHNANREHLGLIKKSE